MKTLEFVGMVYNTLGLGPYKLLLSTRPEDHYIGTAEEWETAESQLKAALDASGRDWALNKGDGAFYGPKIDIVLRDSNGKEHQTATIQLDFQLPQRFNLQYQASPEELESVKGIERKNDDAVDEGHLRPVIVHRAIYGSLERFMALLIEHYAGTYPFWLSPRQAIILSLNQDPTVLEYVSKVQNELALGPVSGLNSDGDRKPLPLNTISLNVDTDTSARPLGKKMKEALGKKYNHIIVIGPKEVEAKEIRIKVSSQPNAEKAELLLCSLSEDKGRDGSFAVSPLTARVYMEELMKRYS
jgi:threonyl-tRNA synthetase